MVLGAEMLALGVISSSPISPYLWAGSFVRQSPPQDVKIAATSSMQNLARLIAPSGSTFSLSGGALEFSSRKSLALTGSQTSWKPVMLTSFGTSETQSSLESYSISIGTLVGHNMTCGVYDSMMLLAKQRYC